MMDDSLLCIQGLRKHYLTKGGFLSGKGGVVRAVDGVDLEILPGETLGLVGESGCGKTTLGRIVMRLEIPTAGTVRYGGRDVLKLRGKSLREYRREVQMVFQDPYSSLNPRKTAAAIVGEPLRIHHPEWKRRERERRTRELMEVVGLNDEQMSRYPHEFSGGQRQRIGIARALILRPRLIIADEPVSSLDVSIQAQILNLLKTLQQQFSLTYLFVTHDLGVVRHMSDRIAVMYRGRIVETGPCEAISGQPAHPYTKALIAAVPGTDPSLRNGRGVAGAQTNSIDGTETGCIFQSRCPSRIEICKRCEPDLKQHGPSHWVACHGPDR